MCFAFRNNIHKCMSEYNSCMLLHSPVANLLDKLFLQLPYLHGINSMPELGCGSNMCFNWLLTKWFLDSYNQKTLLMLRLNAPGWWWLIHQSKPMQNSFACLIRTTRCRSEAHYMLACWHLFVCIGGLWRVVGRVVLYRRVVHVDVHGEVMLWVAAF